VSLSIALELHGVRVRISSELPAFLDYVRVALEPYEVADEGRFDILSTLEWRDGRPGRTPEAAFGTTAWERRPDRDLYVSGPSAQWLRIDDFTDLEMELSIRDETVQLRGRYHFHLGAGPRGEWMQRLRHRRRLDALRGRRFSTLLYYLFYHPLLWWLSRAAGWHVLHGGAVATPLGAIVLAGMPGCGKSTLAVAMLADPAFRMLSDNLVLHDGERALACPELVLLDAKSRDIAGAGAGRLVATGERRVFARDAHRVADVELSPQPVAVILHVERGTDFVFRPIDAPESAARLRAANIMAKEVRRIAIMNEVLDVVGGARRLDEIEAAERLAHSAPSFELRVPPVADLAAFVRERVLDELEGGLGGSLG
jgi:hypothetical protein